ncbi:MAG: hypothetical protein F4Z10_08735 [Synechococcus sp. SB0666_bin_14]|nr:hypothetical protein [Synechococcus sp. SB0666_bin_14]MYC49520.1 hypothetical protein [Synechococcus sp. SB0662_bin_14]MYG46784.1 hypothetical protein [Synechococcus sp. SB0675_bin_6]MYK90722.1 hypothetical protein [Synechococcus sp. SB0669_bin_8]
MMDTLAVGHLAHAWVAQEALLEDRCTGNTMAGTGRSIDQRPPLGGSHQHGLPGGLADTVSMAVGGLS